jgi:predicted nucleotidyltransferase
MLASAPTPHADVNDVLARLLARQRALLGQQLVGLYLYGSLATGDFDRASSDIDFVAATTVTLDETAVAALRTLHAEIATSGGEWGRRLEGAYLPLAALRRDDPARCQYPFLSETAPFGLTELGVDWVINRFILRERGVVIYGPAPATLIDPVAPAELTAAVRVLLHDEWRCFGDGSDAQHAQRYWQAFAVLTMCRALYALEHAEIISKPAAAYWAERQLPLEWTPLIRRALAWRHDKRPDRAALAETLRFIWFVLGRARV